MNEPALKDRSYGPTGKSLLELTDSELRDELYRRRTMRDGSDSVKASPSSKSRGASISISTSLSMTKRLRQYFANLELEPTATLSEVEGAYQKLVERYNPENHGADPEKHRVAVELSKSLTAAYAALLEHFKR